MGNSHVIDHVGLSVSDYKKARKFYDAALKPLGWKVVMEYKWDGGVSAGYGTQGKPFLWISTGKQTTPHIHLALGAETRPKVGAFYKAAIKAGGKANGGPGLREHYHPTYYAAFVFDPDGHNIEAVCHAPETVAKKTASPRKKAAATRRKTKR